MWLSCSHHQPGQCQLPHVGLCRESSGYWLCTEVPVACCGSQSGIRRPGWLPPQLVYRSRHWAITDHGTHFEQLKVPNWRRTFEEWKKKAQEMNMSA